MWGHSGMNGIWRAPTKRYRVLWRKHDSLFVAVGRTRVRLMKPGQGGFPVR